MERLPVTLLMITLNEQFHLRRILPIYVEMFESVQILDSFSTDDTVKIALEAGAEVRQNKFKDFGSQWNKALELAEIKTEWVMKLDPDEEIDLLLYEEILTVLPRLDSGYGGLDLERQLYFFGSKIPMKQRVLRIWRKNNCIFSDVKVNEYPVLNHGEIFHLENLLKHHDSENFEHWIDKQNKYSTAEALMRFNKDGFALSPKIFGSIDERRIWMKKYFYRIPMRYLLLKIYYLLIRGFFFRGASARRWVYYRIFVLRLCEDKYNQLIYQEDRNRS